MGKQGRPSKTPFKDLARELKEPLVIILSQSQSVISKLIAFISFFSCIFIIIKPTNFYIISLNWQNILDPRSKF